MFYVTSGSLHFFENICDTTEAVLLVAFRAEDPVDFSLQAAFGEMSDAVLGNTFGDSSEKWSRIKRDTQPRWIVKRESGEPRIPDPDHFPNPHKFNIEAQNPPILARSGNVQIGSAKTAKSQFWPILDNISMYSVRVEEEGMREPHWHPQTGEMGYVNKGHARMSIMNPDGCVDTYELRPGDVYFVPAAYPHQIEVIGKEDIHFLIFFDQPMPFDIGYRIAATAMSRDVLAATLGVPVHLLPKTPRTDEDPLIVARINPVDKVIHPEGTKGEEPIS